MYGWPTYSPSFLPVGSFTYDWFSASFPFCLCQKIERKPRKFNPLVIPKSLQEALPFASKPKDMPARKRKSYAQRRAVVRDPHERKVHALVQQLQLIRNEKVSVLPFS